MRDELYHTYPYFPYIRSITTDLDQLMECSYEQSSCRPSISPAAPEPHLCGILSIMAGVPLSLITKKHTALYTARSNRPPPPPFDIENLQRIVPPWRAIKEWIPDDEPNLNWFNRPRNPSNPDPDGFDQRQTWKPAEIHLEDGRILVLEYS